MRRGVVAADAFAAHDVDRRTHGVSNRERSLFDLREVAVDARFRDARVADGDLGALGTLERPGVAHLTTLLPVERRAVEHDLAAHALLGRVDRLAIGDDPEDGRVALVDLVAKELGRAHGLRERGKRSAVRVPRVVLHVGACALALLLHRFGKRRLVDRDALLGSDLGGELEGEAVGVVQREGDATVENRRLAGQRRKLGLEVGHARAQRRGEPLLLGGDDALDEVAVGHELGVDPAHLLDDVRDEPVEKRVLHAEQTPVTHRPAEQPAQHVAASLVRGQDAVRDHEGDGARVVGEDSERRIGALAHAEGRTGDLLGQGDDRAHLVGLEVRVHALHDRGDALEAHTGIDVLLRQRQQRAVILPVELHEHEVPVLEVAVAVAAGRTVRRVAADLGALVVVELRARPARAGRSGAPEVVLRAHPHDAIERDRLPRWPRWPRPRRRPRRSRTRSRSGSRPSTSTEYSQAHAHASDLK